QFQEREAAAAGSHSRLPAGGCPGVVGGVMIGVAPGPGVGGGGGGRVLAPGPVVAGGVVAGGCAPLPTPPGPMGGPCCCVPQFGVAPPSGVPTELPEMPLTVVTQPLSSPPLTSAGRTLTSIRTTPGTSDATTAWRQCQLR